MFYDPKKADHGLPHDPFKALVVPRPIGWISTLGPKGEVNLAPYSFFNAVSATPPMVAFSSQGMKDSAAYAEDQGEFVCNFAGAALGEAMVKTGGALPRGESEADFAGLDMEASSAVAPPRVKGVPAALECRTKQIVPLGDGDTAYRLVIGEVVGIFIDDAYLTADGRFDVAKAAPLARLGYRDYATLGEIFEAVPPKI